MANTKSITQSDLKAINFQNQLLVTISETVVTQSPTSSRATTELFYKLFSTGVVEFQTFMAKTTLDADDSPVSHNYEPAVGLMYTGPYHIEDLTDAGLRNMAESAQHTKIGEYILNQIGYKQYQSTPLGNIKVKSKPYAQKGDKIFGHFNSGSWAFTNLQTNVRWDFIAGFPTGGNTTNDAVIAFGEVLVSENETNDNPQLLLNPATTGHFREQFIIIDSYNQSVLNQVGGPMCS